jgi:hypothetical protein
MTESDISSLNIVINVPKEAVFGYVSNPLTLPVWAESYVKEIVPTGVGTYEATTPFGKSTLQFASNADLGTVLMIFDKGTEKEDVKFTQVIPNQATVSGYVFTQMYPADLPAKLVKEELDNLQKDLENLKRILESGGC